MLQYHGKETLNPSSIEFWDKITSFFGAIIFTLTRRLAFGCTHSVSA